MAGETINVRLITLTDGVLSIAMTLLVLDIRLPMAADALSDGQLWEAVLGIAPQLESYGLSFLVAAIFWLNHAQKFRHLTKVTGVLIWLNILFLLAIGLVPFTTSLLAENGNAVSTAIYAGVMAFASLMLGLMSLEVRVAGLSDAAMVRRPWWLWLVSDFGSAAVFLISAGIAFADRDAAKYCWLLLIALNFVRGRGGNSSRKQD